MMCRAAMEPTTRRSIMDHIALGRRLVACKHFRPMRGMRDVQGRSWDDSLLWRWNSAIDVPDLRDPATLGCLLALVREAHAVPFLQVSVKISREHGYQFDCHPHHRGQWVDSEAEALVAALEAAP